MSHSRYVSVLAGAFALIWLLLAVEPHHRQDWLLENVLVGVAITLLVATYRKLPLSKASYTLLFVYLSLHAIGAHYTYAEVPYDRWFQALTGTTFNELVGWERNNFDRLVHFVMACCLPIRCGSCSCASRASEGFGVTSCLWI